MSITHSREKICFPYSIGDVQLDRVSVKKDLGVTIDDKLSFNQHVDDITRKAYKLLGFVFRCGKYFSCQSSMRILYSSLVRSRLEYCSSVWNPCYSSAIDQIERVQKKFTRMFYFKFRIAYPRPSYDQRLLKLNLRSLESRRLENDEVTLYKLVHNHIDTTLRDKISYHQPARATRRNPVFYLPRMCTNYQENSPIYRVQKNHDVYFSELDIFNSSLNSFKKLVRSHFSW